MEQVSRRAFLTGAAAITACGLAGCTKAPVVADPAGAGAPAGTPAPAPEKKGGTKYTTYANPDEIGIVHETSKTEDFDVVVVGTGIGGLTAAMLTAEQDPEAKILLIDREAIPGGNTNFAEINEPGKSVPYGEALLAGLKRAANRMNMLSGAMWAAAMSEKGMTSAWMYDKHKVELASDFHYYKGHTGALCVKQLTTEIQTSEVYKNVDYRLRCQAIALLTADEYTVTGVQIKQDNEYINVNAKAVVLATGGMGNNLELMQYYTALDVATKTTPLGSGQYGDGHIMVEHTAHGRAKGCDPSSGWVVVKGHELSDPVSVACEMQYYNLYVNQYGVRFNSEDYSTSRGGQDHDFNLQGRVWSIMSPNIINEFETKGSDHKSYYYYEIPTPVKDALEKSVDNKVVFKADTLEELAQKINVPVEAFVKQVKDYDAFCAAGEDTQMGKDAKFLIPIGDGPYYAAEGFGVVLQTNNGIRVDTSSRVCDPYFTPIKHLYATGICCSGFMTVQRELGISQFGATWGGLKAARTLIVEDLGKSVATDWFGPAEYQGQLPTQPYEPGKPLD